MSSRRTTDQGSQDAFQQPVRRSVRVASMTPTKFLNTYPPPPSSSPVGIGSTASTRNPSPVRQRGEKGFIGDSRMLSSEIDTPTAHSLQHQLRAAQGRREVFKGDIFGAKRGEDEPLGHFWTAQQSSSPLKTVGKRKPPSEYLKGDAHRPIYDESPPHHPTTMRSAGTVRRRSQSRASRTATPATSKRGKQPATPTAHHAAQMTSWFSRPYLLPFLILLAILKFAAITAWQLLLPLLKWVWRALRTALKQSTTEIEAVMTPARKRALRRSRWNKLVYGVLLLFVAATGYGGYCLAMRIRPYIPDRLIAKIVPARPAKAVEVSAVKSLEQEVRELSDAHVSLRTLNDRLDRRISDRLSEHDRVIDGLRSQMTTSGIELGHRIAGIGAEIVGLRKFFEESMAKAAQHKEQQRAVLDQREGASTLGAIEDGQIRLDPRFVEYLRSSVASRSDTPDVMSAIEEQVKSSLDRQHVEHLIVQQISAKTASIAELVLGGAGDSSPHLPDYALASLGSKAVLPLTTDTYRSPPDYVSRLLGIGTYGRPPLPDMTPGMCWSFHGHEGRLTVRLSMPITPTAFTIAHVPAHAVHDRSSAPQHVELWGLSGCAKEDQQGAVKLADAAYTLTGPSYQTFSIKHAASDSPSSYPIAQLRIRSNHGHRAYTCLYRFMVHGEPAKGAHGTPVLSSEI